MDNQEPINTPITYSHKLYKECRKCGQIKPYPEVTNVWPNERSAHKESHFPRPCLECRVESSKTLKKHLNARSRFKYQYMGPISAIFGRFRACMACGKTEQLSMDHIIPVSKNGPHEISNIQVLCSSCNTIKGTKTIDYRPKEFLEFITKITLD